MGVAAVFTVLMFLWYPAYKRYVFPRILKEKWFRDGFNVNEENEAHFLMGMGSPGISSGFWLMYFFGAFCIAMVLTIFVILCG